MPPEWKSIVFENYKIKKTEYCADLFMIFLMMFSCMVLFSETISVY